MFGRTAPRHARRGRRGADREQAVRRLNRITPPAGLGSLAERADLDRTLAEQAVSDHALARGSERAGGWVPRGRTTSTEADPDGDPDGLERSAGPGRIGPAVRLASRFGVGPAHVVVVAIGLVLALVLTAGVVVRSRPRVLDVAAVPVSSPAAPTGPAGSPATSGIASARATPAVAAPTPTSPELVVQVIGKVRRPGVVRLPPGARVVDAVAAAGGVAKGARLGTLNLARPVVDGEQIAIGTNSGQPSSSTGSGGAAPPVGAPGVTTPPAAGGPATVSLNAADLTALETLPGVGPVLAQRILEFRIENGRFASVDELREVKGIGDKTFAEIAPHVSL